MDNGDQDLKQIERVAEPGGMTQQWHFHIWKRTLCGWAIGIKIGESGTFYCRDTQGWKGNAAASQRYLDEQTYRILLFHFTPRFYAANRRQNGNHAGQYISDISIVSEIRAFGKLPLVFHSRMPYCHAYVRRVAIALVFPVMVRESWGPPVKMATGSERKRKSKSRFRLRDWSTNTHRV